MRAMQGVDVTRRRCSMRTKQSVWCQTTHRRTETWQKFMMRWEIPATPWNITALPSPVVQLRIALVKHDRADTDTYRIVARQTLARMNTPTKGPRRRILPRASSSQGFTVPTSVHLDDDGIIAEIEDEAGALLNPRCFPRLELPNPKRHNPVRTWPHV